jgi:tetratricopeptide (TPR) repeat protein
MLYSEQGKSVEAERLYRRALTIREQRLGAKHPLTAQSLGILAMLYADQGKYTEAEPLLKRAGVRSRAPLDTTRMERL